MIKGERIYRNKENKFRVRAILFNGKNHKEVAQLLTYHQVKKVGECVMIDYEKIEPNNVIYTGFDSIEWFSLPQKMFYKKFRMYKKEHDK